MTSPAPPATTDAQRRAWKRFLVGLGVIAIAGLAVRVWFTTDVVPGLSLPADPRTYHLLGTGLADGLGYVRPAEINPPDAALTPTAEFPPGLPVVIAVATKLGARSPERQALLTCLIGTGTIVLIGLLGRRIGGGAGRGGGEAVGLVAAGIVAVHPLFFQPDGILMSESPYLFLITAVLLAGVAAWDDPTRWWRWVVLGALVGLAALTRTEALLLIPVLLVPLGLARGGSDTRRRITATVLACGVGLLVIAPWSIRNTLTFNRFVPVSTNAGTVLLGSNCDKTYSGVDLGSWDFGCIAAAAARDPQHGFIKHDGPNEADVYEHWRAQGLDYISDHLSEVPKVVAVRVLRTWSLWDPKAQIDFDVAEGRDRTLQTIGYWLGLALLPMAIAGGVVLWRRKERRMLVLLAPVLLAIVVPMTAYGGTRMRAVADPSLVVFAAVAIVAAAQALARRSSTLRLEQ